MEDVRNKKDRFWIRLMEFGARTGCHQMPSRSFSYKGYQFPICARCTGLLVGELISIILIVCGLRIPYLLIFAFIAVMGIDWVIQYADLLYSTNVRRLITGLLCGVGVTYLYFYGLKWLFLTAKKIVMSVLFKF